MPFQVVRNDITQMDVDAIVNTANPNPVIGRGTDSAIYRAAGWLQLWAERKRIGKLAVGQAVATAGHELKARYIIHTVGPRWQDGASGEDQLLRLCYRNSLELAQKLKCQSIAFPLISTGTYRFPKKLGLQIANEEITGFLLNTKQDLQVYLVVYDEEATLLSQKLFQDIDCYIDSKYIGSKPREADFFQYNESQPRIEIERSYMPQQYSPSSAGRTNLDSAKIPRTETKKKPSIWKASRSEPAAGHRERSLEEWMNRAGETFQQMLLRLISEKGYTNAQVYKKANQDKKLFSKIKNNRDYQPAKNTAVAFAIALELNLDETKDFLGRAGFALSPSNRFDLVISYCIENKIYDMFTIESVLFEYHLPTLCNY